MGRRRSGLEIWVQRGVLWVAGIFRCVGAVPRAISPDVRSGHPDLHALDGNLTSQSLAPFRFRRRSIGMGTAPHP